MAGSIVCNRATSGDDHIPIIRSIIASDDRLYDISRRPATDRMINCGILRPIPLSIVGSATDRTINRGSGDPPHDQSWHPATDHLNGLRKQNIGGTAVPPIVRSCNQSGQILTNHTTDMLSYDWFLTFLDHLLVQGRPVFYHPIFSILGYVFSQLVFLHVSLYVVPPSLFRSDSAPAPRNL